MAKDTTRVMLYLDAELLARIEEFRAREELISMNAALLRLISEGLDSVERGRRKRT